MGCCCSSDSDSETLEKTSKDNAENNESYENPLMCGREDRPATYGATSETAIERYRPTNDDRSSPSADGDVASLEPAIHETQCKIETASQKGKEKVKRSVKKIFKKKDGDKGQSQSEETSENQFDQSKKKPTRLNYQDIASIREIEKQKRAKNRAKDLEAKATSKVMAEALQKAHERGERLSELKDATADLRAHSESFAENARRIAERKGQKYLAKKSKKQQKT